MLRSSNWSAPVCALLVVGHAIAQSELASRDVVLPPAPCDGLGLVAAGCSGRLVAADGQPVAGARVALLCFGGGVWQLPLAVTGTDAGGRFAFDAIDAPGAVWCCAMPPAPFAPEPTMRRITLVAGRDSELGDLLVEATVDEAAAAARIVAGRVRAGAGDDAPPVAAALVELRFDRGDDPTAFAVTDGEGRFAIPTRGPTVTAARVHTPGYRVDVPLDGAADPAALELRAGGLTLLRLESPVAGATAAVWNGARWQPLVAGRSFVAAGRDGATIALRLDAPGRAPELAVAELPADGPGVHTIGYHPGATDGERTLRVCTPAGEPLPGVRVALAQPRAPGASDAQPLDLRLTDARGELRLRVAPDRELLATLLDERFAAAQLRWVAADAPGRLVAQPRDAKLSIGDVPRGGAVLVQRAGATAPVAVVRAAAELAVAAGRYDLTWLDAGDATLRGLRVHVGAGMGVTVPAEPDRDDRPTVEVTFAADLREPWVVARRSLPGGMVADWLAASGRDRRIEPLPVPATVEPLDDHRFTVRLARPAPCWIVAGARELDARLVRLVEPRPGEMLSLTVPAATAAASGRSSTWPRPRYPAQHGWAGPRLALVPRAEDRAATDPGWTMLVTLPDGPGADLTAHRLRGLLPGSYHLHHHLVGRLAADGSLAESVPGWGGVAVALEAGATADYGDLSAAPLGALPVRVTGSDGSAAPPGTVLRLADPMYETWRDTAEGGMTFAYALEPLPPPPAIVLDGGTGTLESLRASRIAFEVELPDGTRVRGVRDIEPGVPVTITLPAAARTGR
ncbi:MAG: hypothetical protein IPM29_01285 [Planctomycetes bacterium]|nr:hypothetical protein [Planctomycetota bacterium]